MDEREHQESKLVELILLIAQLSADDPSLGNTKLNKLLYYSDFEAVRQLGEPITGVEYQKLEHGPAPRRLKPVRSDMEKKHLVEIHHRQVGPYTQTFTVPQREANPFFFTTEQRRVVEDVVARFRGVDAVSISEISHRESAGWIGLDFGETIPYDSALVVIEPSEDDRVAAREFAAIHSS